MRNVAVCELVPWTGDRQCLRVESGWRVSGLSGSALDIGHYCQDQLKLICSVSRADPDDSYPMLKNIFSIIGIVSSIFIIIVFVFALLLNGPREKISEISCMDGTIIFLGTRYYNNNYYELIHQTTGFSDKVSFLHLYRGLYPSNKKCIDYAKVVNTHALYYGPEHEVSVHWPVEITVENEVVTVKYSSNKNEAVRTININPVWVE